MRPCPPIGKETASTGHGFHAPYGVATCRIDST
jgi:hypothetical protein